MSTRDAFDAQMSRLALGLRWPPADLTSHFEALKDLPDDHLRLAVNRALQSREVFPTPSELRQDCDTARQNVSTTSGVFAYDPDRRYHCDECRDAGWAEGHCNGTQQCGMPSCATTHYVHSYVKKCDCWETNPVLLRARDQAKRYAVAPAQTKRRRS